MADGVWKGVQSYVIGRSRKLLLNKFFDPNTPSMRKGNTGGEKRKNHPMVPPLDHFQGKYQPSGAGGTR